MSPRRKFDRYMIEIGVGTHPKFAELTDSELRAHLVGVLAIAAMSPIRGCLLVGERQATAAQVAAAAGVSARVAETAMRKLRDIGVIEPDPEHDCERVHDWDDVNPPPKRDNTAAERQQRFRNAHSNGASNAHSNGVTQAVVTPPVTPPEVEVEVEASPSEKKDNSTVELRSTVVNFVFARWQDRCQHPQAKLTSERRRKIEARIREGYTIDNIVKAIDGAARHPFVSDDGKRFDDIELICRSGSKLESFMARADARPASGRVLSFGGKQSPDELIRKLRQSEESEAS